jgi:hypothetical protein
MTPTSTIPPSGTTMTSISSINTTATATTANPQVQQPTSKSKLNLKWISALKRKNKNSNLGRDIISEPVDKSTVCYHYNTVMDPRLVSLKTRHNRSATIINSLVCIDGCK